MIVTLTGAFRNAGDHLIRHRAHQLLRRFVDPDIRDMNRLELGLRDPHLELLNSARAVFLCGGPAYQSHIYPGVYSIDLSRIRVPVIPFGLGWKAPLGTQPSSSFFTPESLEFVRTLHSAIPSSSVRDVDTRELLGTQGLTNVTLTGCPAWYDLEKLDERFRFSPDTKTVVFSAPARVDANTIAVLRLLAKRFPRVRKVITFHHGFVPSWTLGGLRTAGTWTWLAARSRTLGFEPQSLQADLQGMLQTYSAPGTLHVGYRVHAHLLCLSQRVPSLLISEDSRGDGQARTLGTNPIDGRSPQLSDELEKALDDHFSSEGREVRAAVERMSETFGVMKSFLESTPHA
ncbi:MAG: polysaccharide pyruvyl transferase family protein [Bdellovibrionales bacterium]|nr:polysaccharide pyruvyl transferase family protein [Bdellovibrionales bacterium]